MTMTPTDYGREAGRRFWADWIGPEGDGSMGNESADFVRNGPAADAAWDMPAPMRDDPDARAQFVRAFMGAA